MDTIIDQSGGSAVKAVTTDRRRVIFASTLGTIFEWYDFYLYGSLAAVLGQNFFASVSPISAYIFGLLTFSIGFIVRPFGALVFGRLGDAVGRKYTFLATILIMGLATFAVGILPTYASIGILAPIILISLRMLQGLAVGGEYGGAAVYIAEHAASGRRGAATSWLQTAFIFGLVMSLSIILGTQAFMSSDDFKSWGWRIPFLFSLPLLGISVWVRLKLHESPVFSEMKASKKLSSSPIKEAFLQKENFKRVLIVMFGLVAGQGILAASGPIYSVLYLINTLKVDPVTANTLSITGLLIGVPFYVFFGHLSDRIGRKPLFLAAFALGCVSIFPVYKGFTHFANPVLERAHVESPVVVTSDPDSCAIQFNPLGSAKFTTSCDVAKAALVKRGIPYSNENSGNGYPASVRIGGLTIPVPSAEGTDAKTQIEVFQKNLDETLSSSGYPAKADPAQIDHFMVVALIVYLQFLSAMAFGPLAATLVEIFPARVRYTSMSVPYHIGNGWFGGLLPAIIVAVQASTGSIYSGLWYPTVVVGAAFVICLFLVPETRDRDIAS